MQLGLQRRSTLLVFTMLVLLVAGLGTVYLRDRYVDANQGNAHFHLIVFRTGMSVVQDVAQMRSVVARMASTASNLDDLRARALSSEPSAQGDATPGTGSKNPQIIPLEATLEQDSLALTEALDFLYVRGHDYLRLLESSPKYSEEQLVTLISIFSGERRKVFHCRGLQGQKAILFEH